jgi:hypothetical protein
MKLITSSATAFAFLFLIASCSKENNTIRYNEEFNMNIGDKVQLEGGDYLELKSVEDSRCCCLCLCVWEGLLEYHFEASVSGEIYDFIYKDHESFENILPFDDYTLEIVKINPEDNCDESIKLDKYVFTIKLIK